ncbi:methyl-accepting chemotaxis protein [Paenibacillus sp. 1001270B_150601_E10]|uniref:methyl-accepting chemotaxis protein n=1 Tax=Paenibacillus sp. 1001270B_150601_E10 TaxID=2787079 RepID=UPI00189EE3A9|nr:methyl-accepting chemotaxis protein [Paenibacillus sp. 1001270B_150601_E10]
MKFMRKSRKLRESLNAKMVAIMMVLIMLPSWGIIYVFTDIAANQTKHLLTERTEVMTESLNFLLDETHGEVAYMLTSLSNSIDTLSKENRDQLTERLKQTKSDVEAVMAVFAVIDGKTYYSDDLEEEVDGTGRAWYRAALQDAENIAVSQPYEDLITNHTVITFSMKLPKHEGVVGIDLAMDKVIASVSKHRFGEGGFVSLIDNDQKVVSHPYLETGTLLEESKYGHMKESQQGTFYIHDNQSDLFVSYNKQNALNLSVMAVIPENEITGISTYMQKLGLLFVGILIACICLCAWVFSRHVITPIMRVQRLSSKIAEGDLTNKLPVEAKRNDEVAKMVGHMNGMVDQMSGMLRKLQESSASLAASSQQLSANSEENVASIQQMADSIGEVNEQTQATSAHMNKVHEMAEATDQGLQAVVNFVQRSNKNAHRMHRFAIEGEESLINVTEQMDQIRSHTEEAVQETARLNQEMSRVQNMTVFIQQLAKQTHLLALNAGIEAAHAGEHGKGFAVVAEEVRKLAEETQLAASEITGIVEHIYDCSSSVSQAMTKSSKSVSNGQKLTAATSERIHAIFDAIQGMNQQLDQLQANSEQLLRSNHHMVEAFRASMDESSRITEEMVTLAAISEQQNASMQEIAASAQQLALIAEHLQEMTTTYKLHD